MELDDLRHLPIISKSEDLERIKTEGGFRPFERGELTVNPIFTSAPQSRRLVYAFGVDIRDSDDPRLLTAPEVIVREDGCLYAIPPPGLPIKKIDYRPIERIE